MRGDEVLITSISGIRGIFGNGLSPQVFVKHSAGFGAWCRSRAQEAGRTPIVVVGRDGRVTGALSNRIVTGTLQSVGCHVIEAGMTTTPTLEMAVADTEATGGVMLSASHNPAEWNALKLLNEKGEFLSEAQGEAVLALAEEGEHTVAYDCTGTCRPHDFLPNHLGAILNLGFIDPEEIRDADFRVVVDGINSSGAVAIPTLLRALGLREECIGVVNAEPHGRFAHPPEPLPENLTGTMDEVRRAGADLGLVVDPDADRLALIDEEGRYISEELTQVLAADFIWRYRPGPFVTNLSSSRAIEDVAERHGATVHRSAVGEVHVVEKMKEIDAVLGGEGNGGVIVPDLHYGRDALVAVAMILQHLAETGQRLSEWAGSLPRYELSKNKLPLEGIEPEEVLQALARRHQHERLSTVDGVKIDLDEGWVHVRPSNTEPILRIYAEASTRNEADALAHRFMAEIREAGQS